MPYGVLLTDSAVIDLEELDEFILTNDSVESADYVLGKLDEVIATLAEFPERGSYPPELSALGIQDYREIFFKPYRVIYRVLENKVYIYLVVDGRRDMQTLLERRLFSV
ncbi:MAG: type II toxin-antitoxin system RelE/ParE family toxin [Pseudomonadales bacterium]